MPETVGLLQEFGLTLGSEDGAAFAGIAFHDGSSIVQGWFSSGYGLGVRRTHLHSIMAARAAEMGVVLHWDVSVRTTQRGGEFAAAGAPIQADFYVIADGLCSTLAAASGFRERRCYSTRYARRQQFRCEPWSDHVEVYWGDRGQLYVTPLGDSEVNVALLTGMHGLKLRDALPDFPAAERRLAYAPCTSMARGAVTKTHVLRQVVRRNIAVLGDASASVDAITGEGLLNAFRQAFALADALAAGKPERYAIAHRRITKNSRRMARLLLLLDRHPALRKRFIAGLACRPESFAALLRVHLEEQTWLHAAASLAVQMATGDGTHFWPASIVASGHRRESGI
jgi:menaquinone-9 beta-reductase